MIGIVVMGSLPEREEDKSQTDKYLSEQASESGPKGRLRFELPMYRNGGTIDPQNMLCDYED